MFELTLAEVAQITGGTLNGDPNLKVSSVTTDSREVGTGSLFAAIVGERVDGHDFVDQALASGGIASLVSQPVSGSFVLVPTIDPKLDPVVVALGKLSA
ncbi:MAG: UDP-N-acetylmuramoyl-tripeptide--D-alanyl-D-alanine ligase, partial [Actinobacteria bacterium]|nr:UDP-N-acetylmuramoyl-tripeptide--D-alanyl-D-alanine ligase [Actinomycetota bacterium]